MSEAKHLIHMPLLKHSSKRDTGPFFSSKPRDVHKLLQKNNTIPTPSFLCFYKTTHSKYPGEKSSFWWLCWEHSWGLEPTCNQVFRDWEAELQAEGRWGTWRTGSCPEISGPVVLCPKGGSKKLPWLEAFKNRPKEEFGMTPLGRSLRQLGMGTASFPAQSDPSCSCWGQPWDVRALPRGRPHKHPAKTKNPSFHPKPPRKIATLPACPSFLHRDQGSCWIIDLFF